MTRTGRQTRGGHDGSPPDISREQWSWVFERGGKPSLVISTLEALGVPLALQTFFGEEPAPRRSRIFVVPTWTDNQGNGSALNKLTTTHFTASAVLMELSTFMERMALKALAERAPRTANKKADLLGNGDSSSLDPTLEVKINPDEIKWELLEEVLRLEQQAEDDFQAVRSRGLVPNRSREQ